MELYFPDETIARVKPNSIAEEDSLRLNQTGERKKMKFTSLGSVYGTESSKMKQFLTTPGLARRPKWGNPLIEEDDF